jgi:hypothetical protein
MKYALPLDERTTPMQYMREAAKTIQQITMFEDLVKYEPFSHYVKWLTDRYSDLVGISTNMANERDLRDQAAIRANEVEQLVLEISEAINRGKEYSDPTNFKAQQLYEAYCAARGSVTRGG